MTTVRRRQRDRTLSKPVGLSLALLMVPIAVPLAIADSATIPEIPATDFGLLIGVVVFLPRLRAARQFYSQLALPAAWGLVALALVTFLEAPTVGFRGLAAWVFAFRAFSAVFIGAGLATLGVRAERVLVHMATVGALVSITVAFGIAASGEDHLLWGNWELYGQTRRGLFLNGSLAGLELWGRFGVNALADYYAVAFSMCVGATLWVFGDIRARGRLRLVVLTGGMMATGWLVITSGARQALVLGGAVALFALAVRIRGFAEQLAGSRELRKRVLRWARIGAVMVVVGGLVLAGPGSAPVASLRRVVERSSTAGFSAFTSQRPDLFAPAIDSIRERPLTGTGFYGIFVEEGSEPIQNIHNMLLAAVFKMGLIGAALLAFSLWQLGRPMVRSVFRTLRYGTARPHLDVVDVALIVLVVLVGLVTDVLVLTPVIAPLLVLYALRYSVYYIEAAIDHPPSP